MADKFEVIMEAFQLYPLGLPWRQ